MEVLAGADSLLRRPEVGTTAKTNGQGFPNSTQRFISRLNCGRV